MAWKLTITREQNGYTLAGNSDADGLPFKMVIQDDEKDELKSHEELLWNVTEYFNFGGSKHSEERLRIIRLTKEGKIIE